MFGTIFADNRLQYTKAGSGVALESLVPTNGGFVCSIWRPYTSVVDVRNSLTQPMYPLSNIQPDDIPFWLFAYTTVETMFTIECEFVFANPSGGVYVNSSKPFVLTQVSGHDDYGHMGGASYVVDLTQGMKYWFKVLGGAALRIGKTFVAEYMSGLNIKLPFDWAEGISAIYGGPSEDE